MIKPRSAKAKGRRLEAAVVDILQDIGLKSARRQPMSGALQDWPFDVVAELPDGRISFECKQRRLAPKMLDWRKGADCLVIRQDHGEATFVMTESLFRRLLGLGLGDSEGGAGR